jgi:hypothetical protein
MMHTTRFRQAASAGAIGPGQSNGENSNSRKPVGLSDSQIDARAEGRCAAALALCRKHAMSTPRRTTSRRAPKSPFTSPTADESFGDNDDQAERAAARRAKAAANDRARNAASPFKSPGAVGPKRSNSRVAPSSKNGGKLSQDAMMDMYNNCIKLSADNVRGRRLSITPALSQHLATPTSTTCKLNRARLDLLCCSHHTENQREEHLEPLHD